MLRIVFAAAMLRCATSIQFLAPDVDFEKLKATVTSGETFQMKLNAFCSDSNDQNCMTTTADKWFCNMLVKKNRALAEKHCTLPDDVKFLKEKAQEKDVVKLPSGLMYKVLKKGTGKVHPEISSPCLCHYKGTLVDGTEFDSSFRRHKPATFAPQQVIKAWTEAMQLMVEGGAHVAGAFLKQGLCQELRVYLGATLLGSTALPWAQTELAKTISKAFCLL